MLVANMVEDLRSVLTSEPRCATYRVAVARYKEEIGGEILVQPIGSYSWDEDQEFYLNPDGIACHYELEERQIAARAFLQELESMAALHSYVPYARDSTKLLPDGSVASINEPLWGLGLHHEARLVYFYYGEPRPQP